MNRCRLLVYRFFELSHHDRVAIGLSLGLIGDVDEGSSDCDLYTRILDRASDRKQLSSLWSAVEGMHGDGMYDLNPFEETAGSRMDD